MAEEAGTLEQLTGALSAALEPLADKLASGQILETFDELGLAFPGDLTTKATFLTALGNAIQDAEDLPPVVEELVQAIQAEDTGRITAAALAIITDAAKLAQALDTIATQLSAVAGSLAGVDAAEAAAFAAQLVERLLGYAIIEYLFYNHPVVLNLLALAGLVEVSYGANADDDQLKHPVYVRRVLKLERLADWFKDPVAFLRTEYGWGHPAFDGVVLLRRLTELLVSVGIPAEFRPATDNDPATMQLMLLNVRPNSD